MTLRLVAADIARQFEVLFDSMALAVVVSARLPASATMTRKFPLEFASAEAEVMSDRSIFITATTKLLRQSSAE